MPDQSMPLPGGGSEPIQVGDELPVKLDTMMVGGERPEVDDHVEVTVAGRVSRIVDDCAYVELETANNEAIEVKKPMREEEDLDLLSRQMDVMGPPVGGEGPY